MIFTAWEYYRRVLIIARITGVIPALIHVDELMCPLAPRKR
jgi:hypothetical protein